MFADQDDSEGDEDDYYSPGHVVDMAGATKENGGKESTKTWKPLVETGKRQTKKGALRTNTKSAAELSKKCLYR